MSDGGLGPGGWALLAPGTAAEGVPAKAALILSALAGGAEAEACASSVLGVCAANSCEHLLCCRIAAGTFAAHGPGADCRGEAVSSLRNWDLGKCHEFHPL